MGFFSKIFKTVKKVAKVALPAASLIPGIGLPTAIALGAAGGALNGGGISP